MAFFNWLKGLFGKQNSEKIVPQTEVKDEETIRREMVLSEKVLAQMREKTLKPLIRLTLSDERVSIFSSKVGGLPYLPTKDAVPFDSKGIPLQLLAQIDCSELSYLSDFPQKGLLQFWIGQDGSFGLFTEGGCRVIWHETVDNTITEEDVRKWLAELPQPEETYTPVEGVFGLSLVQDVEPMPMADTHFASIFIPKYNAVAGEKTIDDMNDLTEEASEMIWDSISGDGHKISGYPTFSQEDPREENSDKTVLLLQIDSEYDGDETKILWGDGGICAFFCTPEELKKRDFSNVLYNWDCY